MDVSVSLVVAVQSMCVKCEKSFSHTCVPMFHCFKWLCLFLSPFLCVFVSISLFCWFFCLVVSSNHCVSFRFPLPPSLPSSSLLSLSDKKPQISEMVRQKKSGRKRAKRIPPSIPGLPSRLAFCSKQLSHNIFFPPNGIIILGVNVNVNENVNEKARDEHCNYYIYSN